MIEKDKLILVAENMDDSVQSQVPLYDVTLFKSFVDFEKHVNSTYSVVETLIVTSNSLPFTAMNMKRFMDLLALPFLRVKGNVVYLINNEYDLKVVNKFLIDNSLDNWVAYQGDLSKRYITDIASGVGREANEGQVEVVMYRMRAADYIRQQNTIAKYQSDTDKFLTDEDLLSELPDEEVVEEVSVITDVVTEVNYIVGADDMERTLMAFILAQYLALNERTLIIEKDCEFHRLTEMAMSSKLDFEFITVDEIYEDITKAIDRIKGTSKKLIVVGTVERTHYDYSFLFDLLLSNLRGIIPHMVRECDYEETPYGSTYTIVVRNTIPDVLKCIESLVYDVDTNQVSIIGLQIGDLNPIHITSKELCAVLEYVLEKNNISAHVIKAQGITLKGGGGTYDILSILNRGNRR